MAEINVSRLEDLTDRAGQIYNTMLALEAAMFRGDDSADDYGEAMRLLTDLMFEHSRNMADFYKEASTRSENAA